jgi:hypothetical protein
MLAVVGIFPNGGHEAHGVGPVMVTSLVWRRTVFPGPEDGTKAVLVTDIGSPPSPRAPSARPRYQRLVLAYRGFQMPR